jgi:hypothetical protein
MVLQHLGTCTDCEKRFQQMAGEWERLSARAHEVMAKETAAQDTAKETVTADSTFESRKKAIGLYEKLPRALRGPSVRLGLAVGLAALLLLILIPPRATDPTRDLLKKLPSFGQDVQPRTGELPTSDEDLLAGLEAYARSDFAVASKRLSETRASGPLDVFRKVYLGSSLAWTGEYADAITVLESIPLHLVPDPWSGEARWTRYVALRGVGFNASADSLLHVLAEESGEIGERARGLIRKQR